MAIPNQQPSPLFDFDVFLSFRGADTRQSFTSQLYKELNRHGVSAFIDSEDLLKGEKISDLFRYMEASQNFLPVLSKNYAQSKWCLMEAAKMVEIFEAAGGEKRWILPVFYDIDPSELKDDKGSFQVAITEHLKNRKLNNKEEEECRGALRTIGRISGFANTNRDETELIASICKRVKELLPKVPFNTLAIGIDSRVQEVINMLERDSDSVCMIGIWGMGGIGKTTTAKVIYDRLCNKFEASSFISDVRETAKKLDLPSLQAKLIQDVLNKENVSIRTVEEGWNMIKRRLGRKKVLIVLDDIDHNDQLNALVGDQLHDRRLEDLFGTGSKIIVTTRDKAVLSRQGLKTQHGQERIYQAKELEHSWSLKLFRLHAFKYEPPAPDFYELSNKVVEITGGLPLALVVLGAHFAGLSTKEEWEEDMKKVRKDRHEDVLVRLKLSYDGLDFGQQQVFLDIACFLIGSEKEYATYVWEESEYCPGNAIRVLQEKSLLSFDDEGNFSMHDQIRDMGRWIVQKEGNYDPALYSRLWEEADILKVLEDERGSGKEKIQSIDLSSPAWVGNQHQLRHDVFAPMSDLRILRIEHCECDDPLKLPKNMRWLQIQTSFFEQRDWRRNLIHFPHSPLEALKKQTGKSRLASWFRNKMETKSCDDEFNLEKLVLLQLHKCNMRLNSILSIKGVFKSLKVLEVTDCSSDLVESLDFSLMPSLVKLLTDFSSSLDKIDDSIGNLSKLESLSLTRCKALEKLPNSICKLSSLQSLNLEGCGELKALPKRLGDLTMLRELILDGCTELKEIPNSIAQLNQLHHFSAQGCQKIGTFPQLPSSLLTLNFSDFNHVSVISDISTLKYLKELVLDGFTKLVEVPESIGYLEKLEVLSLRDCVTIRKLPSNICQLSSLQKLCLRGCYSISALPEKMGKLAALRNLNLKYCSSLREIPNSIANLHRLQVLKVSGCLRLEHLPKLPSSLVSLDASYCCKLIQVSDLSNLKDLDELDFKGCRSLVHVPTLENLDLLRYLRLLHHSKSF